MDKVIVITGASSGFGKGVALALAGEGVGLVLAARREQPLLELAAVCRGKGAQALAVPTDVSQEAEMELLCSETLRSYGRFDVWINNAGVGVIGRFDDVPLEDHAQVIHTNLLGTIYGSYYAMKHFRAAGRGTLINVASIVGKIPAPYYSTYTASKFGVVGLSASLRQELALDKLEDIHVCTVLPMAHDTPFFDHAGNYTGHAPQPIPPVYQPERVVQTIVELIDDPKPEVTVGTMAPVFDLSHKMARSLTEKMMAAQTYSAQFVKAPPGEDTSGSIHEPLEVGVEVDAGRLD